MREVAAVFFAFPCQLHGPSRRRPASFPGLVIRKKATNLGGVLHVVHKLLLESRLILRVVDYQMLLQRKIASRWYEA